MRPLCVIPARRGSKRLALKNILSTGGRPMLAWTVEAARDSGAFDRVWVSTEDDEVAREAEAAGAVVHPRPVALADDLTSATDVCLELEAALAARGDRHDAIVCLQPSSPLRDARDVRGAWSRFVADGADYLVSVTPIDPHYFHWAVAPKDGWWGMVFGDEHLKERSLLPPVWRPNGAIKIGRTGPLRERRNFFGPRLTAFETPEERSVHVATAVDHALVEALLARRTACPDR